MAAKREFTKRELYERLSFEQYRVTQFGATERPFDNEFHRFDGDGTYHCIVCDEALFSSDHKFNSGTGWPSFWESLDDNRIDCNAERQGSGIENSCATCGAHLGHLFEDRKTPTRQRYCMNSASLRFAPAEPEARSRVERDPRKREKSAQSHD